MNNDRIAIIDCGTNTFHLLIAEAQDVRFRTIHQERQAVRIGQGGISSGTITREARERALSTLRDFSRKISNEKCSEIRAFATSAFRSASNGKELVNEIADTTGIKIRVIDGEKEAELIYKGVRFALKDLHKPALVVDIGGGSVEFIIGREDTVLWKRSYEIGAQRLIDLFYHKDPIPRDSVTAMHDFLKTHLPGIKEAVNRYRPEVLIGSSGSFETLSEMYMAAESVQPISDSELPLTKEAFNTILEQLISLPRGKRREIPGMIEMRIDMIVVASVLIDHLIGMMSPLQLRVSKYALKEGVMSEWLKEKAN
ncbi:MAG: Ppx/GppA phosphatase family protein [Cyclobacteriaceae bacterium]